MRRLTGGARGSWRVALHAWPALVALVWVQPALAASEGTALGSLTPAQIRASYDRSSIAFEANSDTPESPVKFVSRGGGYGAFLTPGEAVVAFSPRRVSERCSAPTDARSSRERTAGGLLRMEWVGASTESRFEGLDPLPARSQHFLGKDPTAWRTDVTQYGQVAQRSLYPGIDLVYYGTRRQLEYDFVVAPGADPGAIRIRYHGAEQIRLDDDGSLLVVTGAGPLRQPKPVIYQDIDGRRRTVDGGYVVLAGREIGLRIGDYDRSRPLVIDPVVQFLGIDANCGAITVDAAGNVYVTGVTVSTDFPLKNAFDTLLNNNGELGSGDVFVVKLNPSVSGSASLLYSTYLGGSGDETAAGIAVDAAGNIYVTGTTASGNFPLSNNALDTLLNNNGNTGPVDVFVTKLNPSASGAAQLVYSTYLGGNADDTAAGIAVDAAGNIYVTGTTASGDFPLSSNALDTLLNNNGNTGPLDVFVTKLNPSASGAAQLVYSTYLGGNADDIAAGIAVDAAGNIHVTGTTASSNFPTSSNARDSLINSNGTTGPLDVFVTKLNPSASGSAQLVYSTYLGGSADETAAGIALDSAGNIYVTGTTASGDFPISSNARDGLINDNGNTGPVDVFVTKLNPSASISSQLVYSTYLGGNGDDTAAGIAVDTAGNIHVTGTTASGNFPLSSNALDTLINNNGNTGPLDVFVTKLNPSASISSQLVYSTYLGGNADDTAIGIAVDSTGNILVAGVTASVNFPVRSAFDTLLNNNGETGPRDLFVTKLNPTVSVSSQIVYSTFLGGRGDEACFVEPVITSFNPTAAPVGSVVVVTGSGLSRATSVLFNTTAATAFTVDSDTRISATVPAGATTGRISVTTPGGTAISTGNFTVTPPPVTITATVATAVEGGAAGRFTVSRTGSTAAAVTVHYNIAGTATNGVDYVALPGTITIPAGSPSADITVTPIDDALDEDSETVILQLVAGTGYSVGQPSSATVRISDNDPLPVMSINSVTVLAGGTAVFTVTLTPVSGRLVTASFATENGTASGSDVFGACVMGFNYVSQSGTVRFNPGVATQTVSVGVCSAFPGGADKTFFLNLTNLVNATPNTSPLRGRATIKTGTLGFGTFLVAPTDSTVAVHAPATYAYTWTVPEGRTWHDLKSLDLRLRNGDDVALWVRFDEASNTFALFNPATGRFGPGALSGSPQRLQTAQATLDMADTRAVGSGPTGPSVTLELSLSFKPGAAGHTYVVEVAAADDRGDHADFVAVGTLTVPRR